MADFVRTATDQVHSFTAVLTDSNGPLDISPGSSVTFIGRLLGATTPSIQATGVIVQAGAPIGNVNRGLVRYDPSTADVAVPGIYYVKWRLTPPGSSFYQSFPEDGEQVLILLPSI